MIQTSGDLSNFRETDNSTEKSFFYPEGGYKGLQHPVRQRIDLILTTQGKKWVEVYEKLGWGKSFASQVRCGHRRPPLWQRIALAKEMGVDSTAIWREGGE